MLEENREILGLDVAQSNFARIVLRR